MHLISGWHGFSFRVCYVSPLQRMIGSVSDEIEGPPNTLSWIVAFRRACDLRSLGTKLLDPSLR